MEAQRERKQRCCVLREPQWWPVKAHRREQGRWEVGRGLKGRGPC